MKLKNTTPRSTFRLASIAFCSLLALAGCSSTSEDQPRTSAANAESGPVRARAVTETSSKTVTVESIDASSLTLMLRNPDGSLTGYLCRPEIRNFDQIRVGDKVTFVVTDETDVSFAKGGATPDAPMPRTIVRAPMGGKPGGKTVDTIVYTGRVMSVDAVNRTVSLQAGGAGVLKTLKFGPDANLAKVKPGEDANVRVTRTSVITVEAP